MDSLGQFKIIKSLGKGGMGEVLLVEDTACQRVVALKKIRDNLVKFKSIRSRFLREAHIAATLTHPSIIPIFSIHEEKEMAYYTMPYVEGEELKKILKNTKTIDQEWGISALMRIFMSICQAVAYCHSKGVLHRDLKPENIIVGKFGEVLILDWGLAIYQGQKEELVEEIPTMSGLTHPGKIVGTLAYLSPERARNEPATEQTDLYALGVILYQILTLRLPFKRTDIEAFQKMWPFEELIDPIEAAPYRDIPHALNQIVKKALEPSQERRYKKVTDMIADLETFVEGKPSWSFVEELSIDRKEDWEFQENIMLAKHIAITRAPQVMEWVNLMISKGSFSGNTKIEASVRLNPLSHGIGFLLNVPKASERKELMDGYCIWIGSKQNPGCKLFRCNIEVLQENHVFLEPGILQHIRIEKSESHLRLYINETLRCHYISHSPLAGTHVGLLLRDADLELSSLKLFLGSQNVTVSCLAIPDSFLASKNYTKALSEYQQIAFSFPGRTEGREALFRAGVTLLENGLSRPLLRERNHFFSLALEEFGKLRGTAGAPLEYLGKSLVYKAMGEVEEEAKCMELAIRKYHEHPLFPRLVEHVIFRLHESALHDRMAAYQFALLSLRHLPKIFENPDHQKLIESLQTSWETLPFLNSQATMVQLAFFLARPITLLEIIETGPFVEEAFYALLALGYVDMVKESPKLLPTIQKGLREEFSPDSPALQAYLFQAALDQGKVEKILSQTCDDYWKLWALLLTDRWKEAGEIFEKYPIEHLSSESSPLFPLFGCYLWATEGKEIAIAQFSGILETPYPRTTTLLGHFLAGRISLKKGWIENAFVWEKMELLRQLILLSHCSGHLKEAHFYSKKLKKLITHRKNRD